MGSRGIKKKNRIKTNDTQINRTLHMVSTSEIIDTINYMIDELNSRGISVKDFDNKHKAVRLVKIIGGRHYFLSE